MHYNLLIIGNNSDAVQAAIAAAEQGQRVALVNSCTSANDHVNIKTLRHAAKRLIQTGTTSMSAVRDEVMRTTRTEQSEANAKLDRLGVDTYSGAVKFMDAQTVQVIDGTILTADSIVLACGTKSAEAGHLALNGRTVISPETLLDLQELPRSMVIVGAGQTGLDYAILLAQLGVEVTVVDEHSSPLNLCANLLEDQRYFEAQSLQVAFRLGDEVIGVQTKSDDSVMICLASGKILKANVAMICIAREGRTTGLDLEQAGVGLDEHGRVWCDAQGRTWAENIRAIGDVVGFRSLAG